ncbi:transglutaminase/protease-like cytokinesis protein 3 [Paenibacillus phyllosphaerae]|uniref:Transglutaminase/protease-like cytokinesis protein 3 n=1 Tax=Paenibacillus phyllosphaerae TaxID=274593 RepID=A0A7W5B542_9BACL|nr:transglutaminase domain-containing protein [Paenibacillus phyllosphaerae]MBB3114577.1 transglutaminase/protease-like cytokinesis protein 3 [Paenibacillus phyllosphaerae]
MRSLFVRIVLIVVVIGYGLGTDFRFTVVQAKGELPATLEALEQDIAHSLRNQQTAITLSYAGNKTELSSEIAELMRRAIGQDDYIAYIVDSYFYSVRSWGTTASIRINVRYRETAEQTKLVDERIASVLSNLITPDMKEEQKVQAIHDWIVLHMRYDEALQRYTAYEALTQGTAVCQGYTLLAYRMLQAAGLTSRIAEGEVHTGSHVWNLVQIRGNWHHMDVTWDDPLPDRAGKVRYAYFLKSDEEMRNDHKWVKTYPLATPYVTD